MFVTFKVLSFWLMLLHELSRCVLDLRDKNLHFLILHYRTLQLYVYYFFACGTKENSFNKQTAACEVQHTARVWLPIDPSWNKFKVFYSNVFQLEIWNPDIWRVALSHKVTWICLCKKGFVQYFGPLEKSSTRDNNV